MNRMKKFAACGLIVAASLSMTACGGSAKAESTASPSATAAASSTTATATATAGSTAAATADASAVPDDEVIGKVGSTELKGKDFNSLYNYQSMMAYYQYGSALQTEQGKAFLENLKKQCYETLIAQEVLYQKAEGMKISATDDEIQETVKKDKANYKTDAEFQAAIKKSYESEDAYKAEIKKSLVINKVIEALEKDIKVTDAEVKTYYDQNKDQFKTGAGADMKHILVRMDSSKANDAKYVKECEDKAKAIKAEIDKGADFDKEMDKYKKQDAKQETYVAEDLGFVEYNNQNYDQEFLKGAKALKEGQVSDPVKSSFGWHIIKATGLKGETTKTLDEVKETIQSTLKNNKLQDKIEELKSSAKVERKDNLFK